jgi:membrane protease YdiL (CAAX protease family)
VHNTLLAQLPIDQITPGDFIVLAAIAAGSVILGRWLLATRFGARALVGIPRRRMRLPLFMPFLVLVVWIVAGFGVMGIAETAAKFWKLDDAAKTGVLYGGQVVIYVALVVLMVCLGRAYFARGLKGFGLGLGHVWQDAWQAAGVLLAVMPAVLAMVAAVIIVGRFIAGDDFKMDENEGLTTLMGYPQFWLKAMVFVYAGVIVPCYEELLFRGLFQSVMRKVARPWAAVMATSALFTVLHPPMHWPAMFVFSLGIGYSYEKSGSLLRAILIHVYFNVSMMVAALAGG